MACFTLSMRGYKRVRAGVTSTLGAVLGQVLVTALAATSAVGCAKSGGDNGGSTAALSGDAGIADDTAQPGKAGLPNWLYTSGNHLFNSDGTLFHGRGASLADTRSCDACTFNKANPDEVIRRADTLINHWNATFVRLTLESYASAEGRTQWQSVINDRSYLEDLVTITNHFRTRGVYVLVSLWTDPNFSSEGVPTAATREEWKLLAAAFQGNPYVLYGVANEPANNLDGSSDQAVWTEMNETVQAIRDIEPAAGPHHIIAVQGTREWARLLTYYVGHPITADHGENVVYEEHFYDPASLLQTQLVEPAQRLPVIIGEFGPVSKVSTMTIADCTKLISVAQANNIPWLAWSFHFRCPPNLLQDLSNGSCGVDSALVSDGDWGALIQKQLLTPW